MKILSGPGDWETYYFGECTMCLTSVECVAHEVKELTVWGVWIHDFVECPNCGKHIILDHARRRVGKLIPPRGGSSTSKKA